MNVQQILSIMKIENKVYYFHNNEHENLSLNLILFLFKTNI